MRETDKQAFLSVAKSKKFWILVRVTNPASLQYINRPGYAPKEIDCKAKTANNPSHRLAGLVVDPYTNPEAFSGGDKVLDARRYWDKMSFNSGKYTVNRDKNSDHNGCLMCNGKYIHGDYDLYDIIDITQPNRNLALVSTMKGMEHRVGANLWAVKSEVNSKIGSPMIQHGGEAQFAGHSEQEIDMFGPNGEYQRISSMSRLMNWYSYEFNGRITLADSFGKPVPNDIKFGDPFKLINGGKK